MVNVVEALERARLLNIHIVKEDECMQTAYMERRNDLSTPQTIYERSIIPEYSCDIGLHLPLMRALAKGDIVEIGVRGGSSTSAFILGIREQGGHLYSIDINPLCGTDVFEPMPEWTFIHGHSTKDFERIRNLIPAQIDILFLDGEHDYPQVHCELELYAPLVKRGGLMLFHDVELEGAGVYPAMMDFVAEHDNSRMEVRHGCYGLGIVHV